MRDKLKSFAILLVAGFFVAAIIGMLAPWPSIVLGVLWLLFTVFAIFDVKIRKKVSLPIIGKAAVFALFLVVFGRAELSNRATTEAEEINRQIASVEAMLADGEFDAAIVLSTELEPKATRDQKARIEQLKLNAETESKLRPGRIKDANETLARLVAAARRRLANPKDVSEEAEKISAQAFAVPLATDFSAAQQLANELVQRRLAAAKSLLDQDRLDEAKAHVQAAQNITGATSLADAKSVATAIGNRIVEQAVADATALMQSEDFAIAEAKLRDALNEPEATEREPATALLKTLSAERERATTLASKTVANATARPQLPEFNTHRRKVSKTELGDGWPLTVDEGEIECRDNLFRLFHHGGKTYALNGIAKSHAKKNGWLEIQAIWKDNPKLGDGFKIDIGPLLEAAGKLCEESVQRTPVQIAPSVADRTIEAWTAAEILITKRLQSPSTASFGGLLSGDIQDPRDCVKSLGNGEYRVKGWVDSQNRAGATVRTEFEMTVKDHGDNNNWSVVGQPVIRQR